MSRFKPAANSFTRPMTHWWWKNPYFRRYMVREGSAVFLSAYALILLAGLYSLARGEAAYNAWRDALATPVCLLFHTVALAALIYHSITWFQVMPKTAPRLPFDPKFVTAGGMAAATGISFFILACLLWATL